MNFLKRNALWLLPILLMLLITPFTPSLDMAVANWAYHNNIAGVPSATHHGFSSNTLFDLMYKFGCIPAQATCGIAAFLFALSFRYPQLKSSRQTTLTLSLCMLIGAGILTHTFFKECWGRPRPRQIVEFGGPLKYRPYYKPLLEKQPIPSKSFPSGHSTCGFYFFCLFFLGRRANNNWLKATGLILGLGLGILLSIARIIQGGHFLSDTFFAALIMWETAYFVDWLVFTYKPVAKRLGH